MPPTRQNYLHEFGERRMTSIPDDFVVTEDETRCIVADSSHLRDMWHMMCSSIMLPWQVHGVTIKTGVFLKSCSFLSSSFNTLTLLLGQQEGRLACEKYFLFIYFILFTYFHWQALSPWTDTKRNTVWKNKLLQQFPKFILGLHN